MAILTQSACLAPPDAPIEVEGRNYNPEVDLRTISPTPSFFEAGANCRCIQVGVEATDPDNETLRARLATNPGIQPQRQMCVTEGLLETTVQGRPFRFNLIPGEHFRDFPAESTHSISLFITDAADFAVPFEELTDDEDCWRIPPAIDGGPPEHVLVEVRWVVRFVDALGTCPGCSPVGGG